MKLKFKTLIISLIFVIGFFFGLIPAPQTPKIDYWTGFADFENATIKLIAEANTHSEEIEFSKTTDMVLQNYTYMISAQRFQEKTNVDLAHTSEHSLKISSPTDTIEIEDSNNIIKLNSSPDALAKPPVISESYSTLPLEEIAIKLGYHITETPDTIILSRPYALKRLIVKSNNDIDTLNAINYVSGFGNLHILQFATETDTESAYNYYSESETIEYVDIDLPIKTAETDLTTEGINDSFSFKSWGAKPLGITEYSNYLIDKYNTLDEVVVGVIDTGIDIDHPWFGNRIANGGKNFHNASNPYNYNDVLGHGTHVSGIITDITTQNIKILPLQVFDSNGKGTTLHMQLAINHAIQEKLNTGTNIKVLNMSLGAPVTVGNNEHNTLKEAIENAYNAGIIVVAAAGNDSLNTENFCPANIEKAITVSALTNNSSTSQILTPAHYTNYGKYVDISAPGTNIVSATNNGSTGAKSGTSMAAPHVAGAIALLMSDSNQNYTLQDIENTLDTTAIDLGDNGWDKYFGEGVVCLKYTNLEKIDKVSFNITASSHTEAFQLTLSTSMPSATIRYTTDGSIPSETHGTIYSEPLTISNTTKVSAFAYVLNGENVIAYSPVTSYSYYFQNDDIENAYEINIDGTITAYNGTLSELVIPSQINNITVTAIGYAAFLNNKNITSVTLPTSVGIIDSYAFKDCTSLKTIVSPGVVSVGIYSFSNTAITSITSDNFPSLEEVNAYAFYNCDAIQEISAPRLYYIGTSAFRDSCLSFHEKATLYLPNVEYISDTAFAECSQIVSVQIPHVIFIGSGAFYSSGIDSLDAPGCLYINNAAFSSTPNLQFVNLNSVKEIGMNAFYQPSTSAKLYSAIMPKVRKIADNAFKGCPIIQVNANNYIYLEETTHIGKEAFSNAAVAKVYLPNIVRIESAAIKADSITEIIFSESIEHIDINAFSNISSSCQIHAYANTAGIQYAQSKGVTLTTYNPQGYFTYTTLNNEVCITGYSSSPSFIPAYINGLPVTSIADGALENCTSLEKINSQYLKHIGANAFNGCSALTYAILSSVTTIDNMAFYRCSSLEYVEAPIVETLGEKSFYGCSSLDRFTFGKNILNIGDKAIGYSDTDSIISEFFIIGYENTAAQTYANDNKIDFENKVQPLSNCLYTTYDNNGNTEITIAKVDSINMNEVVIPEKIDGLVVSKLNASAFSNCNLITKVTLPSTITDIPDKTFYLCYNLQDINLEHITSIGSQAFSGCKSLEKVYLPNIRTLSANAFENTSTTLVIGNKLSSYDNTSLNANNIVYGYSGSLAQNCANGVGAQFIAIDTFGITRNLPNAILATIDTPSLLETEFSGFEIKYQWYSTPNTIENGTPILGANSSTFIATCAENATERYFVKATNWDGEVITSNVCTITISDICEITTIIEYNSENTSQTIIDTIPYSNAQPVTIVIPNITGYHITQVWIDNIQLGENEFNNTITNGYTFEPIVVDHIVKFVFEPNTNTSYLVKHYQEALNSDNQSNEPSYNLVAEETLYGTTDTTTNITPNTYTGFHVKSIANANIEADGSTVIHVFYDRDTISLTLNKSIGIVNVVGSGEYKFESKVEISAVLDTGYNWAGWKSTDTSIYPNITSNNHTVTIGLDDIELTATATLKEYTVSIAEQIGSGEITMTPEDGIVTHGDSVEISIKPGVGFYIDSVLVNGLEYVTHITDNKLIISNITNNLTIAVIFERITLYIETSATNGTINPSGKVAVKYGLENEFYLEPNTGYILKEVLLNDEIVSDSMIVDNCVVFTLSHTDIEFVSTLHANFIKKPITVTTSTNNHGLISVNNTNQIFYGDTRTYTFTPLDGYTIGKILINDVEIPITNVYTLSNITDDTTIYVEFKKKEYIISAKCSSGGTISPIGDSIVKHGESIEYHISPDPGYIIKSIKIDDMPVEILTDYTFTQVIKEHTIEVVFEITQIQISVSCGENGTVSPSGKITLDYGSSQTFTITPNTGYGIKSIKINGIEYSTEENLTLNNIVDNYHIEITFEQIRTITIISNNSQQATTTAFYGDSKTFDLTPKDGYRIKEIKVNDQLVAIQNSVTVYNITADTTIEVLYERISYKVNIEVVGNGNYSCEESLNIVIHGSSREIFLNPDTDNYIEKILINNKEVEVQGYYIELNNIQSNYNIKIVFAEEKDEEVSFTPIIVIIVVIVVGIIISIVFSKKRHRY